MRYDVRIGSTAQREDLLGLISLGYYVLYVRNYHPEV